MNVYKDIKRTGLLRESMATLRNASADVLQFTDFQPMLEESNMQHPLLMWILDLLGKLNFLRSIKPIFAKKYFFLIDQTE